MRAIFATLALAASLAGCANLTAQQQANLQLQLQVAKQIGSDAVQIWCAASGVIYVVANDIDAKARVTVALGKNAKAAADACPMIQNPTVQVTTSAAIAATPAAAIASK